MNVNTQPRVPIGRPDGGRFASSTPTAAAATRLSGIAQEPATTDLLDVGVGAGLAALLPASARRRILESARASGSANQPEVGRRIALDLHAILDARHHGRLTPTRAVELEAEARTEWTVARRSLRDTHELVNNHSLTHPHQPVPRIILDRLGLQVADLAGAQRRLLRTRVDQIALAGHGVARTGTWEHEALAQARRRVADSDYRGAMHQGMWKA